MLRGPPSAVRRPSSAVRRPSSAVRRPSAFYLPAESNLRIVNFLDVTFDLNNGKYRPYRKPNDDPLHINRYSNHPPSIIRQLPTSINKRIALLSSDEQTFMESAPAYQNALEYSNFNHYLYSTRTTASMPQK